MCCLLVCFDAHAASRGKWPHTAGGPAGNGRSPLHLVNEVVLPMLQGCVMALVQCL